MIAMWNHEDDLAVYMERYEMALKARGLERVMPHRARVVTRSGKVLAKWEAKAAIRLVEMVA